MDFTDFFKIIEPLREQLKSIYSVVSFALTAFIVLWFFNFFVGLIQKIFNLGKVIGTFYRFYIHRYIIGTVTRASFLFRKRESIESIN